ncbi:type IV pilus twitching motility protein PilT [Halomonas eurihalina]|uniref:Type IV pilus twitching motility protein PilT n=1 Tax=Halomonas eurihalina TaxID=42566 RepID=A0A5D9CWJ1_HALER|nr:type IV pilus twitching motility protein PilT [Halomonas eurihalina]MDR5861182.1 type IV pilus twitching motility protein PilT [Halomonas eurihalina]TZG35533.1 type IV pilus twitching motility protein PilT [Halomonas eurihalina]
MNITELLASSAKQGASDLHLSAGMAPMIRVDGELETLDVPTVDDPTLRRELRSLLGESHWATFESDLEADVALELPGVARFRGNVFQHGRGTGAVFRTIPGDVQGLAALGMADTLGALAELRRGLVLVTGPTGSGKSTTLAALVDAINETRREHILTIEDPVEFVHHGKRCLVSQREVPRDTRSFAAALRSALREDPDVIMVGEMRDLETMRLALTAAETGHLVLGTLHTLSATKTIDRIIDAFPGPEQDMVRAMLSESLQAVVSQVLLKRHGGGRVAAHEVMVATPAVRNLIREDKVAQLHSVLQTGAAQGMQTLDAALARLVAEGVVAPDEAQSRAHAPLGR